MSELHYFHPDWIQQTDRALTADVCIYGATSAGVVAAMEAVKRGKRVVLLNPGTHVGGLTTGGLGCTDYGKEAVIGGTARRFYRDLGKLAGKSEVWQFCPSMAQTVYAGWLKEFGISVENGQYLDAVEKASGRIAAITMLGGLKVAAKMFIDASYEGDLMARAGVKYHVGREGNQTYGETRNGVQVCHKHQFLPPTVSPFVKENDASSGLLPYIVAEDLSQRIGQGDQRVQAYNFRICMTDDPAIKIPWAKPERYNPALYVLAERWFNAEHDDYNEQIQRLDPLAPRMFLTVCGPTPGGLHKTDTNNHGPISSDFIGANHDWPGADYAGREAIFQAHVDYQQGLYWMMANSPKIPERYRRAYANWGLCRDEFTSTGGWSPQMYIREARRMIGAYVATEHDCMHTRKCADPVGMGSYQLDSHNCSRFVNSQGKVQNDGDVQVAPAGPYGISYRAVVPKAGECGNLLVPVCVSSSHIAYGSVRMEPVFMVLGQSTAAAACQAIDAGTSVQEINYGKLRGELERDGQVLRLG